MYEKRERVKPLTNDANKIKVVALCVFGDPTMQLVKNYRLP